ncbi:hypothetical protein [Maricaulis salignorans]|uniref:hypothetical protein n=1 Tax=Maricaulis salignorans TaxID=144026 RepID=UPI003A8C9F45
MKQELLTKLRLERASKRIDSIVLSSSLDRLLVMVWAATMVSKQEFRTAERFLEVPGEALDQSIESSWRIHEWELETFLNEVLSRQGADLGTATRNSNFDPRKWSSLAECINATKSLEEAEYLAMRQPTEVLEEMRRIAHRQFQWQSGLTNKLSVYRSTYLYAFKTAKAAFESKLGVSLEAFQKYGFALWTTALSSPHVAAIRNLEFLDVSEAEQRICADLISIQPSQLQQMNEELRSDNVEAAYKPSLLRQRPAVCVDGAPDHLFLPVPDILIERISAGIYYDVVAPNFAMTREMGERFEGYIFNLFSAQFGEFRVQRETTYTFKRHEVKTPDLFIGRTERLDCIVECKATRMPLRAKFGIGTAAIAERNELELAKAITQIWKYVAHKRLNLIPDDLSVTETTIGVVCTLDNWTVMSDNRRADFIAAAHQIAHEKHPEICDSDKIPITFCAVEDLELLIIGSNYETMVEALSIATDPQYAGWHVSHLHGRNFPGNGTQQNHPIIRSIKDSFPWLSKLEAKAASSD